MRDDVYQFVFNILSSRYSIYVHSGHDCLNRFRPVKRPWKFIIHLYICFSGKNSYKNQKRNLFILHPFCALIDSNPSLFVIIIVMSQYSLHLSNREKENKTKLTWNYFYFLNDSWVLYRLINVIWRFYWDIEIFCISHFGSLASMALCRSMRCFVLAFSIVLVSNKLGYSHRATRSFTLWHWGSRNERYTVKGQKGPSIDPHNDSEHRRIWWSFHACDLWVIQRGWFQYLNCYLLLSQ